MSTSSYFGDFGGFFVPELMVSAFKELEDQYERIKGDEEFLRELEDLRNTYVGRATPLYFAKRMTEHLGGARIYLKREDLAHMGSHKINNTLGQALLAKKMGKRRVIAETGAGQHGVATATACALLGVECEVYMGAVDVQRQRLNCYRMELLGARLNVVESGSRTLKDAINEAMRDFAANSNDTHFLIGSVIGPHPYPTIVRDFQSVIGKEVREQILEAEGRLPDALVACVGGGSNAMGLFHPFLLDPVDMYGVEAGGYGIETGLHSASASAGNPGILHGSRIMLMQDEDGQIPETHSIAAGLDYPGVGPEHSHLAATGRARYVPVNDREALEAFRLLSRMEGIIPALESSHAIAHAIDLAPEMGEDQILVVNLSGRGDKDVEQVSKMEGYD